MIRSDNQKMGNGQVGIFTLLLVIFFIWIFAGGRSYFSHTRHDLRSTVHDAGQDLKSTGRDAADSIRRTVQ